MAQVSPEAMIKLLQTVNKTQSIQIDEQTKTIRELLRGTIANLEETVHEFKRKLFGSSSEILPSEEEAEEDAAARECPGKKEAAITSHKRKYQSRTSRKELYKNIPIEEVKIDIPEEKRFCPGCNAPKYMMYSSFYRQQEEWSREEINGYNSFEIFPDSAIFAHFKWFSTIPSYVTPLYDLKKKRPGFVVVDVLVKSNITIEDVSFFVEKVNIIRNFKGLPSFAPVLLLNGVSNEALRYLKENKIVVGILSNLFDKKYTETLMNMYNVLRNATAVIMREPQKLEELIKEIAKSEGRFNNAMGDLFECMVGLFFTRIGSRYIELNKQVSNGNGGKYEMDVLVERDGKVIVVECKAYRGKVDRDYVEKWLSSRIPVFRRFLEGIYPGKKFEFSIWSLGGFDESAKELLEKHKTTAKKYKLSYLNKKEIYQYAKDSNDKLFCEQIHKHFKEYGEELL